MAQGCNGPRAWLLDASIVNEPSTVSVARATDAGRIGVKACADMPARRLVLEEISCTCHAHDHVPVLLTRVRGSATKVASRFGAVERYHTSWVGTKNMGVVDIGDGVDTGERRWSIELGIWIRAQRSVVKLRDRVVRVRRGSREVGGGVEELLSDSARN